MTLEILNTRNEQSVVKKLIKARKDEINEFKKFPQSIFDISVPLILSAIGFGVGDVIEFNAIKFDKKALYKSCNRLSTGGLKGAALTIFLAYTTMHLINKYSNKKEKSTTINK